MMRAVLAGLILTTMAAFAQCPKRVLILTGHSDEPYHHWRETTGAIRGILSSTGEFDIRVNEEPRGLTAAALGGYDAVLINYNGPRLPQAAEEALESFVGNGGGMFAFHLAAYGSFFGMRRGDKGRWAAGDSGWVAWPRMIGAQWEPAKIGHAPRQPFEVRWNDGSQFAGPSQAFLANDELYHRITLLEGAQPQATALSSMKGGSGQVEPMVWTNRFGSGRVYFTTLGHDAMAFHQPGMRQLLLGGMRWASGASDCRPVAAVPVKLLVVTGGHSYPKEFYAMLDSLEGVRWTHATTQAEAFRTPLEARYDAVLLHDMWNVTTPAMRERLQAFVEAGKGVVSLHHAIVDYTDWPWWHQEVTGGKYFTKAEGEHAASRYREGVDYIVTPVSTKRSHPVLAGITAMTVHDEVYRGMWHSPRIEVLMETAHPENDPPVVYIGPHPRARVVYIQLGHSAETMENPGFRKLVRNAVRWTARQTD